jgi:hypothetical protein
MDLLANLPYTSFDGFLINVDKIRNGWMNLSITANEKTFNYVASYICDPLNDLLTAAVAIIKKQEITSFIYNSTPNTAGDYLYVFHDLEGAEITWLFKYNQKDLTLIIWENCPVDFDTFITLLRENFNSQSFEILDESPDVTKELVFAIKGSTVTFIKAVVNMFTNLQSLKRYDDENSDSDWGFKYSIEKFNILKEWLLHNGL